MVCCALLQEQLETNLLLRLAENQSIGEATRGMNALVADLKSDDGADDQAKEAAQHHALNEKPVPKRRHRLFTFPQLVIASKLPSLHCSRGAPAGSSRALWNQRCAQ